MDSRIIALFILIIHSASAFFVSSNKFNWKNATDVCTLAAPEVTHKSDGNVFVKNDLDLNISEAVWVGYYRQNKVFDYIGCTDIEDRLKQDVHATGLKHCFPVCYNSTVVGLSNNHCYCLKNQTSASTNMTYRNDCAKCPTDFVACGGSTAMSVYRIVDDAVVQNPKGPCLSMSLDKDEWNECDLSSWRSACQNDDIIILEGEASWLESANRCFRNGSRPVGYKLRLHCKHILKYWTGVYSTPVIHIRKGSLLNSEPNRKDIRYGYIFKAEEGYRLDFSEPGDVTERKILCENKETSETASIPNTSAVSTVPHRSTYRTMKTTGKDHQDRTSEPVPELPTSSQPPTATAKHEKDSGHVIQVGAVGGAVLIMIIAVMVGIFCKRRYNSQPRSTATTTKMDVILADKNNLAQSRDYFTECDDVAHARFSGQSRSEDERQTSTTYDVAVNFAKVEKTAKGNVQKEDVYNKLHAKADHTYDQTKNLLTGDIKNGAMLGTDNTYDSTLSSDVYNSGKNPIMKHNVLNKTDSTGACEDLYDVTKFR